MIASALLFPANNSAQSPIPIGTIPKNLEISVSERGGGQFGGSSKITIRNDRRIEASSRGTLLPKSRSFSELLRLNSNQNGQSIKAIELENKQREKEQRQALAKLKEKVPKDSLKAILRKFSEMSFAEMDPKLMCVNSPDELSNYTTHQSSKGISISYDGFSLSHGAHEGCAPASGEPVEQCERFNELYDFIIGTLKNVRRIEVPWRTDEERKLRRFLEEGEIPNDLEIIIGSGNQWHGGASQSRSIIRSDRKVESSYSCGGCLPRNPRNYSALLNLLSHTPENQKQRKEAIAERARAEQKRLASLKTRVSKKTLRAILARLRDSGFFEMKPKSMNCKVDNFPTSGKARGISIEFEGFSMKLDASEGCDLEDQMKNGQRAKYFELYDSILASISNVRKTEVPWRSDDERKLRRFLEKGDVPENVEIMAESDHGLFGTRYVINPDRTLSIANFVSTTSSITFENIKPADFSISEQPVTKPKKTPKLKDKISKSNIRSILRESANSGFFDLNENLSGDFDVTGPKKTTTISIGFDGGAKQVILNGQCFKDLGRPYEKQFCSLFFLIQKSADGVRRKEIEW